MWQCLQDGGSDSWLWRRDLGKRRFHFVEIIDMDASCGRDNQGKPKYWSQVYEVDLNLISEKVIASALSSCGWDGMSQNDENVAEACGSYGARAPLADESGNNLHKLEALMKRESRKCNDQDEHRLRMNTTVNAIGSTALEFMTGDLVSALNRGIQQNNPDAARLAKMYHHCGGQTLGGQLEDFDKLQKPSCLPGDSSDEHSD